MRRIIILTVLFHLTAAFAAVQATESDKGQAELTLWMIPFEPPFEPTSLNDPVPLKKQLTAFNHTWGTSGITILNTTVDWMVDQLVVWNPEYDLPNWALIRGQAKTLEALAQFSRTHNAHLHIRFLTWKTIISALEKVLNSRREGGLKEKNEIPDVVQIGSTWAAYFAEKKISLSPGRSAGDLSWRKINTASVSLPYTTDVRMMFYWKRLPQSTKPFRDVLKTPSDWQGIIDALSTLVLDRDNPAPPMVMPTGLTFNLFHDFAPLVWASGEPFFVQSLFGTRTDMGKQASLKVPFMISQHATTLDKKGRAYRIISFPEMSQESAGRHFMKGVEYVAIIKPAAFLSIWRRDFMKHISPSPNAFWDYAGIRLLPAMFKGGTDLMVVNGTRKKELSFQLVRFLASDDKHSAIAAENGHLPAQNSDFGLSVLLDTLGGASSSGAKNATRLIREAIKKGREYPPIPQWPLRMESIEILEAMQMLWRRIGEGNVQRVGKYAGKVALDINSRIYWPSSLWVLAKRLWPGIAFVLALAFFGLYLQSRKITWRNRLLRIAVDSLRRRDYVMVSRAGAFVSDCCRASEGECEDFSEYLHDLRTRTLRLEENIRKDLEHSGHRSFPVSRLVREAWENAASQYRVAYPSLADLPRGPVLEDGLDHLAVCRMPYVLVAILQDWFYNTMKNDAYESDDIDVSLWRVRRKKQGLAVGSRYSGPHPIVDQPFGPLPQRVFDLICEQSKGAYGRVPIIKGVDTAEENHSSGEYVVLLLPAPII